MALLIIFVQLIPDSITKVHMVTWQLRFPRDFVARDSRVFSQINMAGVILETDILFNLNGWLLLIDSDWKPVINASDDWIIVFDIDAPAVG